MSASPYASYGARLGGWLIDFLIVIVVSGVVNALFNAGHVAQVRFTARTTTNGVTTVHVYHYSALFPVVLGVVAILYGALMCGAKRGQTVGMMAVNARAVDRDSGTPIGFGRALGRAAFEYLLFLVFFVPWVVDMLFPAWDARRQTLHDKVTKTVVVRGGPSP